MKNDISLFRAFNRIGILNYTGYLHQLIPAKYLCWTAESNNMIKRVYRLLLPTIALLLVSAAAKSQSTEKVQPDNAKKLHVLLAKAKSGTAKSMAMLNLGNYFDRQREYGASRDSSILYFHQSYAEAMRTGALGTHLKLESLRRLGEILTANGKINAGNIYFLKAVSEAQAAGNQPEEATSWFRMAAIGSFENRALCYQKAIGLYHALKSREQELDARLNLALLYEIYTKFDLCDSTAYAIIRDFQGTFPNKLATAYYLLSQSNRYQGNLNISLLNILKCIETHKDIAHDMQSAALYYGELGLVYQEMGDTQKSIYWYRKTIAEREKWPGLAPIFIIRTVGFIVQQLIAEHRPIEALNEILSLEKRKAYKNKFDRALIAQIKGECYDALKKPARAEQSYLTSLKLYDFKAHTDGDEITQLLYYDIARFYIGKHDYTEAARYLKRLNPEFSRTLSMNTELLKFKEDSAMQNNLSAITHLKAYKEYSDSIFSIAKTKQFEELQIIYRTKEREKDFALLRKTESLQRERITSAEKEKKLTLAGVALLIVLIALLFNGYRVKQKSNNEIRIKNESLNQLITEKDNLLEEKQWLLKEIHHRVKNNLQIVMGLLQRQSSYINNKEALAAMQNTENRMQSIALIHQKLYQSQDINSIFMPEYINELITNLTESTETGNRLQFEKNVDGIYLDVSQAVPLGLILNEAITNAIKYAYPNHEYGVISVSLCKTAGNILLTIADAGVGLPPGFAPENATTLGLSLIKGLNKQLSGQLTIKNENGLTLSITFKPAA